MPDMAAKKSKTKSKRRKVTPQVTISSMTSDYIATARERLPGSLGFRAAMHALIGLVQDPDVSDSAIRWLVTKGLELDEASKKRPEEVDCHGLLIEFIHECARDSEDFRASLEKILKR